MLADRPVPDRKPARRRDAAGLRLSRELAVFGAIYALYDSARWIFAGNLAAAQRHAHWVIHLERTLHVSVEGSVQRALGFGVTGTGLSYVYLVAQLLVLPGSLIWLYRRAPGVYRPLRSTVIGMWLISIPVFALYPVAPPRLAGIGIKDTVSHQAGFALTGHSTLFYNPYAAVPSLHVGLAFAIGIAVSAAVRRRWAKLLALGWGPLVTVAVVATGNHYLFDAATGVLLASFSYVAFATPIPSRLALRGARAARAHPSTQEFDHACIEPYAGAHSVRLGAETEQRPRAHPVPGARRASARPALPRRPANGPERPLSERLRGQEGPAR